MAPRVCDARGCLDSNQSCRICLERSVFAVGKEAEMQGDRGTCSELPGKVAVGLG